MSQTELDPFIVGRDDLILVTGATGFIGSRLVENLLERGFRNLRCFTRASSDVARVEALSARHRNGTRVEVIKGNLLSHEDCAAAAKDVAIIFHLAAARGEKSFPDAFLNSVVTTRNLLEACLRHRSVRRFVNVSSFAVYSNTQKPSWRLLDESCPVEKRPQLRGDAYCFAQVNLCSPLLRICALLRVGAIFGLVPRTVGARFQSQRLARLLEEDPLQQ